MWPHRHHHHHCFCASEHRGGLCFSFLCSSCVSNGSVPEHRSGLPRGGGGGGRGWIWWRLFPLPAGQDGHTVLFTQILLRPLTSFDLSTQNSFLLDHLHHGGVSAEPRHLEMKNSSTSTCPQPSVAALSLVVVIDEQGPWFKIKIV